MYMKIDIILNVKSNKCNKVISNISVTIILYMYQSYQVETS